MAKRNQETVNGGNSLSATLRAMAKNPHKKAVNDA
jgi:hypothetical protein